MKEATIEKRTKIDGDLIVEGDLSFEPEGGCGTIEVTGAIRCKNLRVKPGWSIRAGRYIDAGGYIHAGGDIDADGLVFSAVFELSCSQLKTGKVPFWREYYLVCPILQKHHKVIRERCWDAIREALKPEAKEICAWEGWHPIVRAQLEMFLGLRESVPGEELKIKIAGEG